MHPNSLSPTIEHKLYNSWYVTIHSQLQMIHFLIIFILLTDDKKVNVLYNIPVNDTKIPTGNCGNGTVNQTIFVTWQSSQNTTNSFGIVFSNSKDGQEYVLYEIIYELFAGDLPNGNNDTLKFYHVGNAFETPKDRSYYCTIAKTLNLTNAEESTKPIGTITVSNVQLEAYHKGNNKKFSSAMDCLIPNTNGKY